MIHHWIEPEKVLSLLHDLRSVETGILDMAAIESAPLLAPYRLFGGAAYALKGIVEGHPRLPDGREIVTSQLFWLDTERGLARTMNRWYRLGRVQGVN